MCSLKSPKLASRIGLWETVGVAKRVYPPNHEDNKAHETERQDREENGRYPPRGSQPGRCEDRDRRLRPRGIESECRCLKTSVTGRSLYSPLKTLHLLNRCHGLTPVPTCSCEAALKWPDVPPARICNGLRSRHRLLPPSSQPDRHRHILRINHIAAPSQKVGIHRHGCSVESESRGHNPGVGERSHNRAYKPKSRRAIRRATAHRGEFSVAVLRLDASRWPRQTSLWPRRE